jgi:adenine-specific DNA-methyltransferase
MKYLGNKNRLLDFISSVIKIDDNNYKTSIDLCCGTGTVSEFFKTKNVECHSVDLMNYSYIITKTKIELNEVPKIDLLDFNNIKKRGFISDNYSESSNICIFKDDIAEHIDGSRQLLEEKKNKISIEEYNYILSSILEASDFRSNIMGSYASFYKKGWRKQSMKKWELPKIEIKPGKIGKVYQSDVITFLSNFNKSVDFIYMDPPYNHRQYSDNFHIIETISLYDNPITKGKIRSRINGKKSNFCYKTKALSEFDKTFELSSKISDNFYLSYSTDSIISIDELKLSLLNYYKNVEVHEIEYRQFKTNSNTKKINLKEVILYAKK